MYLNENVQSIFSYIQTLFGFSSSGDRGRKRPLIVFDSSSTNTGSVKLKKPDPSPAPVSTDRLKPPVSSINLTNPIRKLSGTSTNSVKTPVSSPGAGPKSPCNHSKTANSSVHSNNTMSNRKRTSPSDGEHNTSVSIKLTPWKSASLAWQVLCGVDCSDCNCFIFCGSRTLSHLIQRKRLNTSHGHDLRSHLGWTVNTTDVVCWVSEVKTDSRWDTCHASQVLTFIFTSQPQERWLVMKCDPLVYFTLGNTSAFDLMCDEGTETFLAVLC